MTARIAIEREKIVEAAISLVQSGGWEAVSARAIAALLNSSTMPIYSGMGSMEELKNLTRQHAVRMLEAAQLKKRTGNAALDLAVGYVAFAREEPQLFKFAIQGEPSTSTSTSTSASASASGSGSGSAGVEEPAPAYGTAGLENGRRVVEVNPEVRSLLETFSDGVAREDFLLHSWIFTHGLAELLAAGAIEMDDSGIIRHLEAAGAAFYIARNKGGDA